MDSRPVRLYKLLRDRMEDYQICLVAGSIAREPRLVALYERKYLAAKWKAETIERYMEQCNGGAIQK